MQESVGSNVATIGEQAATPSERSARRERERESSSRRRSGYLVGAIVNFLLLYLASSSLIWQIPYLTSDFVAPLAVIKLSLAASAVAQLAFLAYDEAWFRHLVRLGLSAIAFAATYSLLTVFPFDFPDAIWTVTMDLALKIALVGIVIGAIVELCQLVYGLLKS
jgi:hypothetical protein